MNPNKAAIIALKNILKEGVDDVFPKPFELLLIRKDKSLQKKIINNVSTCLKGNSFESLKIGSPYYMLVPKNKPFAFRKCALLDPIDGIKFLALVLMIAEKIERKRIPSKNSMLHSYRFKAKGDLIFNKSFNYQSFQRVTTKKTRAIKSKILIHCDIADFYDRLNLHRLESILSSIGCEKWIVNTINELLLFWSNRDSYGLPVGGNASRILAEAALIEIDNYLLSRKINFIRFVDDYRLFAPDIETAHNWLVALIERLNQEGLTINPSKTKIEDIGELLKIKKPIKTGPVKIIAGYGGTIPVKFRKASETEFKQFKKINLKKLIDVLENKRIIEENEMSRLIRLVANRKAFKYLPRIITLIRRYPQFLPFLIDILVKHSEVIPGDLRDKTKAILLKWFNQSPDWPEYLAISFIRIFTNEQFLEKNLVFNFFKKMPRDAGAFVGRIALEGLIPYLTRGEVLELRRFYNRANRGEKRAIIKMVNEKLTDSERRPWLKNIKRMEPDDLLVNAIFEKPKQPKKKKKKG